MARDITATDLCAAATATPDWHWDVVGLQDNNIRSPENLTLHGWVDDVWSRLGTTDVVITHAGQNALAEVAAARPSSCRRTAPTANKPPPAKTCAA